MNPRLRSQDVFLLMGDIAKHIFIPYSNNVFKVIGGPSKIKATMKYVMDNLFKTKVGAPHGFYLERFEGARRGLVQAKEDRGMVRVGPR